MKKPLNTKRDVLDILSASLVAMLFTLLLVLVFALVVRLASPNETGMIVGNCAIRLVSVFAGVLIAFRNPSLGALKGALSGLLYFLLTVFVLAAADGFENADFNVVDFVAAVIAGTVSGIIAVNTRAAKIRS